MDVRPATRPGAPEALHCSAVQALLYGGGEGQGPSPARGKGGRPGALNLLCSTPVENRLVPLGSSVATTEGRSASLGKELCHFAN